MLSKEKLSQIIYTNLVGHSHYSMPFGVGKIKDHIASAAKKGHRGFALVDDYAMNGILEAYSLSKDKDYITNKLKKEKFPILLGTKLHLTDDLNNQESQLFNVSVYATNWTGYKNMTYLTSQSSMPGNGYLDGDGHLIKRLSLENLAEKSEGLVIGSGNIEGILAQAIIKGTGQEEDLIQIFKEIFGERFFIEIHFYKKTKFWSAAAKAYQEQTEDIQKVVNKELIRLAKKYDVKCCLVQDSYMPDKKFFFIQNILIANHKDHKSSGFYMDTEKYIMSVEEMYNYIQENSNYITDEQFVEFCENTNQIVDLCNNIYLDFEPALPKIDYEEHPVNSKAETEKYNKLFDETHNKIKTLSPAMAEIFKIARVRKDIALETTLKAMIRLEKMQWDNADYLDRLALELKVLQRNGILGLLDYFLLLEDVTNFIRDNGYLRGYGRGCLTEKSKVLIIRNGQKTWVSIKSVKNGDLVFTASSKWSPVIQTFEYDINEELITLTNAIGDSVCLTEDHKCLIGSEFVEAKNIEHGDQITIVNEEGRTYSKILKITKEKRKEKVYDLMIAGNPSYLTDFGTVHNSGGGSLLTYVMDISDIEPIKYKLLFERFFTQDRIGAQFHDIPDYAMKQWSKKVPKDIDEIVEALNELESMFDKKRVKEVEPEFLKKELFYVECNESLIDYYKNVALDIENTKVKKNNDHNSTLAYVLGITDDKPKKFIKHSEPTMPDFDYDTDGRDAVKQYLTDKHGRKHVTLIGTLGSLKTKGAVKDVIRQLKPSMPVFPDPKQPDELSVNELTMKFEVLKANDEESIRNTLIEAISKGANYDFLGGSFNTELAYFYACLEAEPKLKEWFNKNKDIEEAVTLLLGNAKNTGIHAGGIVVSRKEIMELCPLTWDHNENVWVTQYEMAYVEKAGLIKYDFLGLSTLEDFNRCLKLVNSKYNKHYTLSNIPMDDQAVFKLFTEGKTESVFQFNTDLPISLLTQLKEVSSIGDLAIITALLRPGPMKMGMHNQFIKLKNGEVQPTYLHPALEDIWKETYSLCAFQETVIQTVKKIGLFPPDVSVAVMKALSKKQKEKVAKFEKTFVDNAMKTFSMSEAKAKEIWEYLFAFSEYGFNASHSYAYCCVSYLCMWFKKYYPAEWISAVLTGATKDDFKVLYPKWKDYVKRPSINESKDTFAINKDNKVVMPFSAVNGVGVKAVNEVIKGQPYASFQDFLTRSNKSVINKKVVLNMIFSGIFEEFKPDEMSEEKWRKTLVGEYYKHKFAESKPSKAEREEAIEYFKKVTAMNRGQILMEEISLLNFTAFDYFDYYHDKMIDLAKRNFGQQAVRPEKVREYPTDSTVVVGGSVQEIVFKRTKKGDEMAVIKLSNAGEMITVQIFPKSLAQDDASDSKILRSLKEYTPIIIRGRVNRWEGRLSIAYEKAMILL